MTLIDPFEEIGKADTPPQSSTRLGALVPTGSHVGHGLDLKVVRGPKKAASGTALEHYRGKKTATSGGPFGKRGGRAAARGLALVEGYAPSAVPVAQKGAKRIREANMWRGMRGRAFQDGSSKGSRIGKSAARGLAMAAEARGPRSGLEARRLFTQKTPQRVVRARAGQEEAALRARGVRPEHMHPNVRRGLGPRLRNIDMQNLRTGDIRTLGAVS